MSCTKDKINSSDNFKFDIQGHRGCRGILPENSIPAMIKATELGVSTLEMDVVVSADRKIILSHEPYISPEICLDAEGNELKNTPLDSLNIFKMNASEIRSFDCGSKELMRFPEQRKMKVFKPELRVMVESLKEYCDSSGKEIPDFNIEIKSRIEWDGEFHPPVPEYCELLISELKDLDILGKTTIQSFDPRVLVYIHEKYPEIRLSYLLEQVSDWKDGVEVLAFKPEIISPYYPLLSKVIVDEIHESGMKVIPWTINEKEDIRLIMGMGVDGIISDYPDRVLGLRNQIN